MMMVQARTCIHVLNLSDALSSAISVLAIMPDLPAEASLFIIVVTCMLAGISISQLLL